MEKSKTAVCVFMHVLQPEEEIDPLDPNQRHTFEEKKDYFQKIGERESQSLWIKSDLVKKVDWLIESPKTPRHLYSSG